MDKTLQNYLNKKTIELMTKINNSETEKDIEYFSDQLNTIKDIRQSQLIYS